jgi:hypothetical protein
MRVRPLIMEYLTGHPGEYLHLATMTTDLGLTVAQVQQGMMHFVDKGLVEIVVRGNTWFYEPKVKTDPIPDSEFHYEVDPLPGETVEAITVAPVDKGQAVQYVKETGDLFEVVKYLNSGKMLLQNSEGVLYVAERLGVQ